MDLKSTLSYLIVIIISSILDGNVEIDIESNSQRFITVDES